MLTLGDPFQNILTLAIIGGFGYIIYAKWKGESNNKLLNLFSKAKEVVIPTDLKGKGGGSFGK